MNHDDWNGAVAGIAVFRASNLAYVGLAQLAGQPRPGWVAINPHDGRLYTSAWQISSASPLFRYTLDFDAIDAGRRSGRNPVRGRNPRCWKRRQSDRSPILEHAGRNVHALGRVSSQTGLSRIPLRRIEADSISSTRRGDSSPSRSTEAAADSRTRTTPTWERSRRGSIGGTATSPRARPTSAASSTRCSTITTTYRPPRTLPQRRPVLQALRRRPVVIQRRLRRRWTDRRQRELRARHRPSEPGHRRRRRR
jgi:hypothetical protein